MLRKPILPIAIATLALCAGASAVAWGAPHPALIGWTAAFFAVLSAAWLFTIAASASRQLRTHHLLGHRSRSRQELLRLVRELRDACTCAAACPIPQQAPAMARADCDRLSQCLLGFHLGRGAWDPLARDLAQLRDAIRASHAMLQLRPEQLKLIGSPFRLLQEECDEMLQRHAPVPRSGSARRPLKSGTVA